MNSENTEFLFIHAIVRGKVQGVYFRAFTQHHANILGIAGFVRNLYGENAVEICAEGERKKLEQFLRYLHQGPPHAVVESVEVREDKYSDRFSQFEIRY